MAKPRFRKNQDDNSLPGESAGEFDDAVSEGDALHPGSVFASPDSQSRCTNTSTSEEEPLSLQQIQSKLSGLSAKQSAQQTSPPDPFLDAHPLWKDYRKIVISIFLCWNLIAIGFHMCAPSIFRDRVLAGLNPYLWYTGLWQDYCVFAPNPKDYNIQLSANVYFGNGQKQEFRFPNPANDNHLVRMMTERYRKWGHDNVNQPQYKVWWPDTCRWIARKYNRNPASPPVKIELVRQFSEIKPPGSNSPIDGPVKYVPFYTYELQPGDMQ
jgi:hypothetical protein